jgi:hypothetical protein
MYKKIIIVEERITCAVPLSVSSKPLSVSSKWDSKKKINALTLGQLYQTLNQLRITAKNLKWVSINQKVIAIILRHH